MLASPWSQHPQVQGQSRLQGKAMSSKPINYNSFLSVLQVVVLAQLNGQCVHVLHSGT